MLAVTREVFWSVLLPFFDGYAVTAFAEDVGESAPPGSCGTARVSTQLAT